MQGYISQALYVRQGSVLLHVNADFDFPKKFQSKISPVWRATAISRFRDRLLSFLAAGCVGAASAGSARVGCWLLSEHVRQQVGMFAQAIARAFDLKDAAAGFDGLDAER